MLFYYYCFYCLPVHLTAPQRIRSPPGATWAPRENTYLMRTHQRVGRVERSQVLLDGPDIGGTKHRWLLIADGILGPLYFPYRTLDFPSLSTCKLCCEVEVPTRAPLKCCFRDTVRPVCQEYIQNRR